jgi:hypothetical protein
LVKQTDGALGKPREVAKERLLDATGALDNTPESFRGPLGRPLEPLARLHGKTDARKIRYREA